MKVSEMIREFYPAYYRWEEYPAEKCIAFGNVDDRWGILGNFAPVEIDINGVKFANTEQLFQMMKFTDRGTLLKIHASRGMRIKYAAKAAEKAGLRRPDWPEIIVDAMKFCLQAKFEQSEEFRLTLAATAGLYIVEDETKRRPDTWGAKREGDKFVGSNLLGRLLMELRDNGRLSYTLPADTLVITGGGLATEG